MVLLHAGVGDRRMWEPQARALDAAYRVVRPDLRGFGGTPLPGGRFSHAEDVVALLDHLRVDRAALVGASFGGAVALEVAAAAPDRVSALVLLCAAADGVPPSAAARAFDEQEDALLQSGDLAAAVELNVATWVGPEASEEVRDMVRTMQRHAFEVQLAADEVDPPPQPVEVGVDAADVPVPALVVSGGHDLDHFQAVARHLATALPDARSRHLGWAGHLPSLERPDEVTALLETFLAARGLR